MIQYVSVSFLVYTIVIIRDTKFPSRERWPRQQRVKTLKARTASIPFQSTESGGPGCDTMLLEATNRISSTLQVMVNRRERTPWRKASNTSTEAVTPRPFATLTRAPLFSVRHDTVCQCVVIGLSCCYYLGYKIPLSRGVAPVVACEEP